MPQIDEPYFIRDSAGNPVAAVVPIADYEILIDALEEINDLQTIAEARANGEFNQRISLADVQAQFATDAAA